MRVVVPRNRVIALVKEETAARNAVLGASGPENSVRMINKAMRTLYMAAVNRNFTETQIRLGARRFLRECERGQAVQDSTVVAWPRGSAPEPSRGAPRRVAVVANPDDQEFPFREIVEERLTTEGAFLLVDWESSYVPVGNVHPDLVREFRNERLNGRADFRNIRGSRPRGSAPEPSRGAPRRVAVVANPDDQEFPFREIVEERLTTEGAFLLVDWESSYVPVGNVHPDLVREFRNERRNGRADFRNIRGSRPRGSAPEPSRGAPRRVAVVANPDDQEFPFREIVEERLTTEGAFLLVDWESSYVPVGNVHPDLVREFRNERRNGRADFRNIRGSRPRGSAPEPSRGAPRRVAVVANPDDQEFPFREIVEERLTTEGAFLLVDWESSYVPVGNVHPDLPRLKAQRQRPEPSRGAPRRVAVVANPDDQEFPFREIVEERLTTEGAFLLVDWESSYVPVGNVHPDLVREFRNERRNGRADFRNIRGSRPRGSAPEPSRGAPRRVAVVANPDDQEFPFREIVEERLTTEGAFLLVDWESSYVPVGNVHPDLPRLKAQRQRPEPSRGAPRRVAVVANPDDQEFPFREIVEERLTTEGAFLLVDWESSYVPVGNVHPDLVREFRNERRNGRADFRNIRGSRPRGSAPEPSRGAPRRVAVVANPDDQEFPFREIVEERLTTEGAFLLVDWESSYVPVGNVHPDLVREFRNERRNGRADFRNIRGSRPRGSAPEPSRGTPRRVAVVANPDDQEFPFREIVEERLTTEGAFLLVDWESSYVPVGNVHPDLVREFRNERRNGRADFRNIRGSRPRGSAPEPSRGAPRRVAVVANPDDQEFPFREIVEERLTTEGAFLLVDWESSYVPVGNVHPDLVREFRNERRNGRADFRNM
ncbi:uncharacterized protein IUM83_05530 [Phytophthora cinnamomi]|uniref:uncharacterized protein n=1 Tax=Phytophthora cinnamomi TaxID=4785 RepID=UPI00355A9AE2|nr:hypothetical protein IUM83_05530 [Phytophthora cinnamomi]